MPERKGGSSFSSRPVQARAGVGLKPEHFRVIIDTRPDVGFFEVHAENYMGAGGPPHRYLTTIRDNYPLSLHGVGLSIGAEQALDKAHLARLKALNERYQPGLFSEHLAWSTHESAYYNDLLPLPYNADTVVRVADHIDEVQATIGRRMLLENPSNYLAFAESTMSEVDFLKEIVRRTGCGLLLDVNNVHVSAINMRFDAAGYLDAFPVEHVGEIHLAGYDTEQDDDGAPLLIDTHNRPVDPAVWQLYEHAIARVGAVPTLIEWDNDVPEWPVLYAEVAHADELLAAASREAPQVAAE